MKKESLKFSTTQIIMISFLIGVFAGSILLSLPISSATGKAVPYIDALFTATTSLCVTGLVTVPTVSTWSVFGQIVILFLIQLGGLGIITVMFGVMISFHRRMGMKDRMLIQDAFNLNTMSGIVKFIKKVILGTFIVEGIGALLYMLVFVPEYGMKGIWISVFNAVSAFCNAGIDIISVNSLSEYVKNPVINIVTSLLIIMGGIGFIVWWDVIQVLKDVKKRKLKVFTHLTLHSKIAIFSTIILIGLGTLLFLIFEYNNPLTMKDYSLFDKIQAAFFQSVTTRTAGYFTVSQTDLTNASAIVSLLLMFIGGSPVGTAGGIKTVTFFVLLGAAFSTIRNKEDVVFFERTITKQAISKAVAVVCISFLITFISTILLACVTKADALDLMYETVSATATVGLTRDLTPTLNVWGKLIIIATMYLGRVGPISLVIAFNKQKDNVNIVKNPTEKISIG